MRDPDARRAPRTDARPDQPSQPTDTEHATARLHEQPSLFAAIPTMGTARKNDPSTSKQAAQSMTGQVLAAMQAEVLDALRRLGREGTLDDVVGITGREKGATSRRLTDLETGGLIRRTDRTRPGRSGRQQTVWRVVADG